MKLKCLFGKHEFGSRWFTNDNLTWFRKCIYCSNGEITMSHGIKEGL